MGPRGWWTVSSPTPRPADGVVRLRAAHEAAQVLAHELGNLALARGLSPLARRLVGHAARMASALAEMLEQAVEVEGG